MPEGYGNINLECDFIELDDMMNTTEPERSAISLTNIPL